MLGEIKAVVFCMCQAVPMAAVLAGRYMRGSDRVELQRGQDFGTLLVGSWASSLV